MKKLQNIVVSFISIFEENRMLSLHIVEQILFWLGQQLLKH